MRTLMDRPHDDHTFFKCIKKAKMYVEPIKRNETYNIAYRDLKMNSPGRPQNWEGNIKGFIILRFLLIILVILQIFSNILSIITSGLLLSESNYDSLALRIRISHFLFSNVEKTTCEKRL